MRNKGRYVSSLDLKLLGAKFITVPESHLEMSTNLTEIRRSRGGELTSINVEGTTAEHSFSRDQFPSFLKQEQLKQEQLLKGQREIGAKEVLSRLAPIDFQSGSKRSSLGPSPSKVDYSQEEKKEICKYQSLIRKIKKDNDILHRQITNLYRSNKQNDHEPKTKAVKSIFKLPKEYGRLQQKQSRLLRPMRQELQRKMKGVRTSPPHYDIYQKLNSDENPYREESLQIQKKLSSNNLHKNFQIFLQNHNKRVPEFIKQIR